MMVQLDIVLDVFVMDEDGEPAAAPAPDSPEQISLLAAIQEAVRHCLAHGQGEGFVHPYDETTSLTVRDVGPALVISQPIPLIQAIQVLQEFIEDINSTGGLVVSENEFWLTPAADPTWSALGMTYQSACKILGQKPMCQLPEGYTQPGSP